jgi:hypothetical protein
MTKFHGGSPTKRQGVLNRGTARKPSPVHGGSGAPKGIVHDASKPQARVSWHALAAAAQKRGS